MGNDKKLLEPIEINGMKLKNRIGFAPMLNMPRGLDWGPDDRTAEWFEARAKGGAGLLVTGTVLPIHALMPNGPERFAKVAEAVQAHGAKLGVQVGAGGPMIGSGPSEPPYPDARHPKQSIFEYIKGKMSPMPGVETVTAMSVNDIEMTKGAFALAAKAFKDAGVDCIELHCAHGGATLFASFISPFYNRREDEYGGNWENRLRFPTDVIKKMREAVGDDYPLLVRINADDLLGKGGVTLEDATKIIVPAFEEAGVDCFDVSQGSILHAPEGITIPMYYPRGCYIHNAEAVKKVTKLPVIGVGRIVDLDMAEKFLQEGKADLIYMARQLTSDPDTPNKYFDGRPEDIRKCIGCMEGCGTPCPINYDIGPESFPLTPGGRLPPSLADKPKIPFTIAKKPKKVLVIGGGIAGMEAARVCAMRGHEVILMEKSSELGGAVAALALNPQAAEFRNIVDYLAVQMRKLDVEVRVCHEVGADDLKTLNPDAVIMATGASFLMPEVATDKPGVMDHIEALRNRAGIGRKVVIWGLMYGAELAISLAEAGRDVTLIGEAGEMAMAVHAADVRRWWIARKLVDFNAVRVNPEAAKLSNPRVMFYVKVEDITTGGVSIVNKQGSKTVIPYDTLIVSRGRKKNDSLFAELEGKTAEIHKIGDCSTPGNILKAIWTANDVARTL